MSDSEIIAEALNLPLTERLQIINRLIESFNTMNGEVEALWREELQERKKLLEEGKLKTISYKEFFGED